MEIQSGKYVLCSDPYCYWIMEEMAGTKRSRRRVTGYFGRFEDLIENFFERKVRRSEACDMKALLLDIEEARREAEQIIAEERRRKDEIR